MCVGAAHSFDVVKRLQRARSARGYANVAPHFRSRGPEYIDPDKIHLFLIVGGQIAVCKVDQINYLENYDVAVFTVRAPTDGPKLTSQVAMDLGTPFVGEEVAVIAHHLTVSDLSVEAESSRGVVTRNLDLRLGVVNEVQMGPSPLPGQSFVFRTTIPVTPGMSGAPVATKPVPGGPLTIRGVVSSDASEDAAFHSFHTAGRSTMSMLWPVMGLGLNVVVPPSPSRFAFLGELLAVGVFDSRSDRVSVTVGQPSDMLEVSYTDERVAPPTRVLLSTTGHPFAKPTK